MKPTNLWDFACKHPFLFTFGITTIAATIGNVIISAIAKDNEKENNQDGNETDNVQSSTSV